MKAKKEISRELNNDIETIKFHIIEVNDISPEEINEVTESYEDDYEDAYYRGIYTDFDGMIIRFDVDDFVSHFEDDLKSEIEIDEDDDRFTDYKKLIVNKLKKYQGYILEL